jgi:pilus assembly protein FimV
MKNRLTHSLLIAAGALAYHGNACALNLGDLAVHSSLNQPLRADLVLLQANPADASRVRVAIRPAGAVEPGSPAALFVERFRPSIMINPAGQLTVEITSPAAIREPILNFVVDVRMPGGTASREFSVLLDPPGYVAAATARQNAPAHLAAHVQHGPQGAVYGPVQPNETLWRIASRVRPDKSISVGRMVEALYDANPQAFIKGDRNRLKAWATLTIPGRDAILAGRTRPATEPVKAVQPAAAPVTSAAKTAALKDELNKVNTRIAAADQQTQQLKAKLQSLKDDVADLEARSTKRDAQIAALLAKVSAQSAGTGKTTQTAPVHGQQTAAAPVHTNAQPPAASQPPAVVPAPVAKAATGGNALAGLKSMLPAVGATTLAITLSGALLLAALAFAAWRWRRRSDDHHGWRSRKARDAELLSSVSQKANERLQLEEDISSIIPMQQKSDTDVTSMPAPTEEELRHQNIERVMQEADLHLAYGHYDKAGEVLKAALETDGDSLELQFKLAETHLHAGDEAAFLKVAAALHDNPQARASRQWPSLIEMGRKQCPANPLFDEDPDQDGVVTSAQILKFARR